jgi:hypothetical protein
MEKMATGGRLAEEIRQMRCIAAKLSNLKG